MRSILFINQSFSNNLGDQAINNTLEFLFHSEGYQTAAYPIKPTFLAKLHRKFTFAWFRDLIRLLVFEYPLFYLRLAKEAKHFDTFFLGGGQLLINASLLSPINFYLLCAIARLNNKKCVIGAVGAGPVTGRIAKFIFLRALLMADKISARDAYSLEYMTREIGLARTTKSVQLVCDPVFAIQKGARKSDRKIKTVGFSILAYQHPDHHDTQISKPYFDFIEKVSLTIKAMIEKFQFKLLLIPTELPYDAAAIQDVLSMTGNCEKLAECRPRTPNDLKDLINGCDLVIGTRMHPLIFAASNYIPILGINPGWLWSGKMASVFASLGVSDYLLSWKDMGNIPDYVNSIQNWPESRYEIYCQYIDRIKLDALRITSMV